MLCSFRVFCTLLVLAAIPTWTIAQPSGGHRHHARALEPRTNAARMAIGLPPLPPRKFAHFMRHSKRHAATRVNVVTRPVLRDVAPAAPLPSPSAGFVRQPHRNIRVSRADNRVDLGYVSKAAGNGANGYGITPTSSLALQIRFHEDINSISLVSPSKYPFLGLVVDDSSSGTDLKSGSATFLQLAETAHTQRGSAPALAGNSLDDKLKCEASVWSVSESVLRARWVNSDGTVPNSKFWYIPSLNTIVITSDPDTLSSRYPGGIEVVLSLV